VRIPAMRFANRALRVGAENLRGKRQDPSVSSGAARAVRKACPKTKTILLTRHDEDQYVTEALRAGVKGYVLKHRAAHGVDWSSPDCRDNRLT
jgi:DNA-binding NarL/FixJ family response regulator